jgi:hypothetical protein
MANGKPFAFLFYGKAVAKRMSERRIDEQFAQNRAFPGVRKNNILIGTDAK